MLFRLGVYYVLSLCNIFFILSIFLIKLVNINKMLYTNDYQICFSKMLSYFNLIRDCFGSTIFHKETKDRLKSSGTYL